MGWGGPFGDRAAREGRHRRHGAGAVGGRAPLTHSGQAPRRAGAPGCAVMGGGCPQTLQSLRQPHKVLRHYSHSALAETKATGGGLPKAWKGVRGRAGIHTQVLCGDSAAHPLPPRCDRGREAWWTLHAKQTSSVKKLCPSTGTEGASVLAQGGVGEVGC